MATVTGTLWDFGLASIAQYMPQIIFTPSGPATTETKLFATRPIVVTPAVGGAFSVDLKSTDDVQPAVWYRATVRWLDSAGEYVSQDSPDFKLFVPAAGGAIGSLLRDVIPFPSEVWVGETDNPDYGFWFQPSTNILWR